MGRYSRAFSSSVNSTFAGSSIFTSSTGWGPSSESLSWCK
jgi:hypothetical protein